jgi:predicted transcriptional regulator
MPTYKLTAAEEKLASLLWSLSPIASMELIKIAERELAWKKSTTFTILKKLCDKGVFRNENATVSAVLTREQFIAGQSRRYVEDTFGGSLPRFLTSFIGGGRLTEKQAEELRRLIDEYSGKDARDDAEEC